MFVTVKYGDNQSKVFNANCRIDVLLNHIKLCCECADNDVIDVSDERGLVKNLRLNLLDYGTDYLERRESLILLRVDNQKSEDNHERVTFVPLLSGLKLNRQFSEALNPVQEEQHPAPKGRRRSSAAVDFNLDELKSKRKGSNGSNTRKTMSRRSTTKNLIKTK